MGKSNGQNKRDRSQSAEEGRERFRLQPRKPRGDSQSEGIAWSVALKTVFRYAQSSSRAKLRESGAAPVVRRTFNQRCAVRVVYAPNKTSGQWRAHGRYIARDSATRDCSAETNVNREGRETESTLEKWQSAGDERLWKIIISPEFGERLDLDALTREVMSKMERDLKTRLEWVAFSHFNTEHPHVHVALRGIREDGSPLKIDREYIRCGIRRNAEDVCTKRLGYRTELDAIAAKEREVGQHRFTSLDKAIAMRSQSETANSGVVDATHFVFVSDSRSKGRFAQARQHNVTARLRSLEQMGLANQVAPSKWKIRRDFDVILKAMQRASDHQRMLASNGALLSDDRLPLVVVDKRKFDKVEGRVLMHGEDENGGNTGRHYVMIEGTDAKVHLMYYTPEMEEARSRGGLRTNSFVRLEKLFVSGQPIIEIDDFGSSEAVLRNQQYMSNTARNLVERGIVPTEAGWGGWLGRYQAALYRSFLVREARHSSIDKRLQR